MNDIIFLYITNSTRNNAEKIATWLLEKRLVACANITPITSMYRWEGKIVSEGEVVLLLKTIPSLVQAVTDEVSSIHPYTVPCIVAIPAQANESYFSWVCKEVENP